MPIPYPTTTNTFQAVGYDAGTAANDRVLTDNVSNTFLSGGAGDDYITLTNWNLNAEGGDGNDVMEVADSNVALTGGAGADYFVFDSTLVADLPGWITEWGDILDYTDGTDKIAILNVAGVTDYAALQPYMTQVGSDVRISITGQFAIDVFNTSLASLDATDFTFSASGGGGGGGTIAYVDTIAELRAAIQDTTIDTIRIAPGTYTVTDHDPAGSYGNAGFHINRDVTIEVDGPVGSHANFVAGADFSKSIFYVTDGVSTTFNGIGFYDTRVNGASFSHNEAGIRFEGVNLTVLNSHFENCYNGILAAPLPGRTGGRLVVEDSVFFNNGDPGDYPGYFVPGQEHHIYWQGLSATVDNSDFTNSGYGHSIKLVVDEYATITNNMIDDSGAPANSAINSTGGGALTVTGNTIIKSAESENPYMIYYETLRSGGDDGAITISNNIFTSAHDGTIIIGNLSNVVASFTGNTINGGPSIYELDNTIRGLATMSGNLLNGTAFNAADFQARATQGTSGADVYVLDGYGVYYTTAFPYSGAGGNDTIVVGPRQQGPDALLGGFGDDTISGGPGSDFVYGEDGNDVLFSGTSISGGGDNLFGGAGNDTIVVNPRSWTYGSAGLYADGGDGDDVIDGRYADDMTSTGGRGNDLLIGSFNPYVNYNWLNGGEGSDTLFGGVGQDNMIDGGTGADTGTDIAVYQGAYGVDLTITPDTYFPNDKKWVTSLSPAGDLEVGYGEGMDHIELIQFSNGVYNIATGLFTAGQQLVDINAILALPVPTDPGQQLLPFDPLAFEVNITRDEFGAAAGTSGSDLAHHGWGDVTISLGAGNDIYLLDGYYAGNAIPVVTEATGQGVDTVIFQFFGIADYTMTANTEIGLRYMSEDYGSHVLTGNSLDNIIGDVDDPSPYFTTPNPAATFDGADGNDFLYGGNGNDTLIGGAGNDTAIMRGNRNDYTIAAGNTSITDNVTAGSNDGTDSLSGIEFIRFADGTLNLGTGVFTAQSNGSEVAFAGDNFSLTTFRYGPSFTPPGQTLTGTAAVETLNGGVGNDTITALGSDDAINGNAGDDLIRVTGAADGFDAINGGTGNDTVTATAANAVIGLASLTEVETITSGGFASVSILGSAAGNVLDFTSVTLAGITKIDGGAGADAITGSAAADTILGSAGNDTLAGGDDDDVFQYAGTTNDFDVVDGGAGTDTIAALANGTVIGLASIGGVEAISAGAFTGVSISGTGAADALNFSAVTLTGITAINGGLGNDSITGNAAANTINGGDGNDTLNAGDGNDALTGGAGTNSLDGGAGTDLAIYATARANYVVTLNANGSYSLVGSGITDTLWNIENVQFTDGTFAIGSLLSTAGQTITGTANADVLTGTAGNDTITGLALNDTINGGNGDDSIRQSGTGAGFDVIDGGAGNDTLLATAANTALGITSITGVETISSGGLAGVYLRGNTTADNFNFTGVTLTGITYIDGGSGNDTITGSAGADTMRGSAGVDSLSGGDGNDVFQVTGTGAGLDVYNGGAGTDTLVALANSTRLGIASITGVETISSGGFTGVSILLNATADNFDFSATTLSGITLIDAAAGNDTVTGSIAADTIMGGAGNDVLNGGDGDDTFRVTGTTHGLDIYNGGAGTDTVIATAANTVIGLFGASNIETFSSGGFAGVSILLSTTNDSYNFNGNTLTGITKIDAAAGNDTLTGSAVADTLMGGTGQDVLTGAGGADHFSWDDGQFGTSTEAGADRVTDFTVGSDKLNLSLVDANTANGTTDNAFTFIGTGAFTNVAGQLRYQQINGNTYAMGDQNGDGAADFWVRMDGLKTLTAADFVL